VLIVAKCQGFGFPYFLAKARGAMEEMKNIDKFPPTFATGETVHITNNTDDYLRESGLPFSSYQKRKQNHLLTPYLYVSVSLQRD